MSLLTLLLANQGMKLIESVGREYLASSQQAEQAAKSLLPIVSEAIKNKTATQKDLVDFLEKADRATLERYSNTFNGAWTSGRSRSAALRSPRSFFGRRLDTAKSGDLTACNALHFSFRRLTAVISSPGSSTTSPGISVRTSIRSVFLTVPTMSTSANRTEDSPPLMAWNTADGTHHSWLGTSD